MIVDAHCHLQDERITPLLPGAMDRADTAGVKAFVCCGTSETDWDRVLELSGAYLPIHASLGLHPWYVASRTPDWLELLRDLLVSNPNAGIGEIGLDHALENADMDDQYAVFEQQLALARELKRPVSIHCRRAWQALLSALDAEGPLKGGAMVHSFSGSVETMHELVGRGINISLSGSVTRRRHHRVRAVAGAVPNDHLLVETDSPDIMPYAPRPDTGEQTPVSDGPNVPEHIVHVVRELAALRHCDADALADTTTRNAVNLFGPLPTAN